MTTQYANASYQEIIDLHTESDSVSVIGIHTPCSDTPYHMLKGFWDQFRKFKYNGCSISLVPAAQLPADPLQVSYDAGEPTIDPRDMLNPILFHGCHGDDLGAILNGLYSEPVSATGSLISALKSDSIEQNLCAQRSGAFDVTDIFENLYYRALTDKTWLKAHPQRGFRKTGLHPMIYSVASTFQIASAANVSTGLNPYSVTHDPVSGDASSVARNNFGASSGANVYQQNGYGRPVLVQDGGSFEWQDPVSKTMAGFVTPRLQRLGWMDTRNVVGPTNSDVVTEDIEAIAKEDVNRALVNMYLKAQAKTEPVLTPKIFMGMIMLPPAYKTEQHFRLVLNHSFSFAKFRGASMQYPSLGFVKEAYPVFNFSGEEDSKKIDPIDPEKGDGDVKSADAE